jgi:hypothetical protein
VPRGIRAAALTQNFAEVCSFAAQALWCLCAPCGACARLVGGGSSAPGWSAAQTPPVGSRLGSALPPTTPFIPAPQRPGLDPADSALGIRTCAHGSGGPFDHCSWSGGMVKYSSDLDFQFSAVLVCFRCFSTADGLFTDCERPMRRSHSPVSSAQGSSGCHRPAPSVRGRS